MSSRDSSPQRAAASAPWRSAPTLRLWILLGAGAALIATLELRLESRSGSPAHDSSSRSDSSEALVPRAVAPEWMGGAGSTQLAASAAADFAHGADAQLEGYERETLVGRERALPGAEGSSDAAGEKPTPPPDSAGTPGRPADGETARTLLLGLRPGDLIKAREALPPTLERDALEPESGDPESELEPSGRKRAREFDSAGRLRAQGEQLDEQRVGHWDEWYENGTRSAVQEYDLDGERVGEWRSWYEDGSARSQGSYIQSLRHGRWITYHPNGKRKSEVEYRMGRREGFSQEWYSNEQIKEAGFYRAGRREGFWQFFDYQGLEDRRTGDYEAGHR